MSRYHLFMFRSINYFFMFFIAKWTIPGKFHNSHWEENSVWLLLTVSSLEPDCIETMWTFWPMRLPNSAYLMLIISSLMTPHHPWCFLWILASKDSLKDCDCILLMMATNANVTQGIQENVTSNSFSSHFLFIFSELLERKHRTV